MPQLKAAKKSLRKNARQRAVNDRWRGALREAMQTIHQAISDNNKKAADQAYLKVQKVIDRAARHNIIHPNKAARQKSRLLKAIQKLN